MRVWIFIIFIVIPHFEQILSDRDLPKGAKIVERCPKNKTAWETASKILGCAHSGKNTDKQTKVYHCLPSSSLNEYVEFCGITAPLDQGNCPVFHYINTKGKNRSPSSWNCSTFSSGCPKIFYYSRDVYKYPECLDLDRDRRCFRADTSCMNDGYSTRPYSPCHVTALTSNCTIEYDIMNKTAGQNKKFYVVLGLLIFFGIVAGSCIMFKCIRRRKNRKAGRYKGQGYHAASLLKVLEDGHLTEEQETTFSEISGSPVTRLLCQIAEEIQEENIAKLKFLLKSNLEENSKEKNNEISTLDRYNLFSYMDKLYNFNVNMYILMGYLESIQEGKQLKKCEEFVKNADHPLIFFTRKKRFFGFKYTKVYLKVAMDIKTCNRLDISNIVKNMQKLLGCKKDDIIIQGITEGCILLHLDVKSSLLETLRKCDFSSMRKIKVFKISIMKECIFHCPNLDDNFHKKESLAQKSIDMMFNWLIFFKSASMKICKTCQKRKQSRSSKDYDITQVTAVFEAKIFSQCILSFKPIIAAATAVAGLAVSEGVTNIKKDFKFHRCLQNKESKTSTTHLEGLQRLFSYMYFPALYCQQQD